MSIVQIVALRGRRAAILATDRLIIPDALTGADRLRIQAKTLCALEIAAGERPGRVQPRTRRALRRHRRGGEQRATTASHRQHVPRGGPSSQEKQMATTHTPHESLVSLERIGVPDNVSELDAAHVVALAASIALRP
jgi:hypothetical protein